MEFKLLFLFKMHLANLYANVAFPIPLIPLKMYAFDIFFFFRIFMKYCSILKSFSMFSLSVINDRYL